MPKYLGESPLMFPIDFEMQQQKKYNMGWWLDG